MTAALVTVKKVKARKTHRCEYCRRPIWRGERYEFATGLWDDAWFTEHRCIPCTVLWDLAWWYWEAGPDDEIDCVESVREAANDGCWQAMVAVAGLDSRWGTAVPAESGEASR